jgi:hypothetical protein
MRDERWIRHPLGRAQPARPFLGSERDVRGSETQVAAEGCAVAISTRGANPPYAIATATVAIQTNAARPSEMAWRAPDRYAVDVTE